MLPNVLGSKVWRWTGVLPLAGILFLPPRAFAAEPNVAPANWDGIWYRTSSPASLVLDHATDKTVDFQFMTPVGDHYTSEGQATIHGNSAAHYNGHVKITFSISKSGQIRVSSTGASGNPLTDGTYVQDPIHVTLSVPSPNMALITGHTLFVPGTLLEINVNQVCWETTVGTNGLIRTANSVSWLRAGRNTLVANVFEMPRNARPFDNVVASAQSNSVETLIDHMDIAADARRYYKLGTPAFAVANYVYTNRTRSWSGPAGVQLQGIEIYHLQYTSTKSALASTRLQVVGVDSGMNSNWQPEYGTKQLVYYTFKLSEVQGKWVVDGNDLDSALARETARL